MTCSKYPNFLGSLDGSGLLLLNESILAESPFNISDENVRVLLVESIQVLKNYSVIEPVDFWSFKVI
jgi:hypothetical protein